ncbi:antichymotrypsin-2-like isoform X1 [Zophobas morio]|uniref:antichymotrypsin-2-like isoform X1 n=1 Tax=Zophobas morio TaxID=2755281 RepID=UPI003083B222
MAFDVSESASIPLLDGTSAGSFPLSKSASLIPVHHYFRSGNQMWAADMYKEQTKNERSNFLMSPFAAQLLLALTQSGAKSETALELQTKLHFPLDDRTIRAGVTECLNFLRSPKDFQIIPVNKIYVRHNLRVKQEFKQLANAEYKADADNVDFSQKVTAAKVMNDWVAVHTRNQIQDVVSAEQLRTNVGAVMVSGLYFQGRWDKQFSKQLTKMEDFFKDGVDVVKVPMMHVQGYFQYCKSATLQTKFLEMPFKGGQVSMIVALPLTKDGLHALEEKADKVLCKMKFKEELINLTLPKFQLEKCTDLKKILMQRGIQTLFSNQADLSGIAGKKGELSIELILQKTAVRIDEEGATTPSTTDTTHIESSLFKTQPKDFIVDHPFMFYVSTDEIILYAGRVLDPRK